ncbi:hypothetical protein C6P40_001415 [Pichia californica]|uniref:Uncharacterized protein n=1 Tax=Pichia californica TaxID=460514 RepID=A0A9P7BFG8_9ASCO|nr:hypothetical protein C6P42_001133 [[Candida] californica]KAG0688100.1 hypothetical protein C6P40_001415 [[Candida] californica]
MLFQSLILSFAAALSFASASKYQSYPLSELDPTKFSSYSKGQDVSLQCIRRQIDTGEHIFDDQGNILYSPFYKCLETNAPLSLKYMEDSNVQCTIKFEDEVFHMFQLYLHKDAPFTCRFELRPNSGIYLPIDLSFRGNVLESHFDIDPNLNMVMIANNENEIISGTGFSSSTNTTKVIIGQNVELNFNVKWSNLHKELINDDNVGVYWIPPRNPWLVWIYAGAGVVVGIVLTFLFSYRRINRKIQLESWNKVE